MFSLFWWRGTGLGSGLLFHLFPDVDFAPHGIYSMIGAVAVLASFKQMSFLAHLMRWKSYFIVVATCFCFMSVWFTFLIFSLSFLEISWDQVSDVSFTMPCWSGFCGFHELLSWCSQFFSNPGDADKHGIICHGPWQNVCHKTCLICVSWHWGIPVPRILKYSTKIMSMKPMLEASGLVSLSIFGSKK